MQPGKRLPGKVAIITGGASGIGEETAHLFAHHAPPSWYATCRMNRATAWSTRLPTAVVSRIPSVDVRSEDQWIALVADVERKYGRVDVLCNVAGISGRPPGMTVQASGVMTGMALAEQNAGKLEQHHGG